MALRNFSSSAAQTSLAAGISGANTSIQVVSTTGFPAAPFILALDAGASSQELVLVTAVAGTTLTVTRGYDSTVATTHDAGATVVHSHGGIDFREANSHVNASSGVHGLAGSVVGTSDAQTLTSKDLTASTNSFPASDTGVTSAAGVDSSSSRVYKRTNLAILSVNVTNTSGGTLAAGTTLCTVPVGYRPPATVFAVVYDTTGPAMTPVHIDTAGVVTVQASFLAGRILRGSIAFAL